MLAWRGGMYCQVHLWYQDRSFGHCGCKADVVTQRGHQAAVEVGQAWRLVFGRPTRTYHRLAVDDGLTRIHRAKPDHRNAVYFRHYAHLRDNPGL